MDTILTKNHRKRQRNDCSSDDDGTHRPRKNSDDVSPPDNDSPPVVSAIVVVGDDRSTDGKRDNDNDDDSQTGTTPSTILPILNETDKGHRYGNFHNYYAFHPVTHRTSLLSRILDIVATEFVKAGHIGGGGGGLQPSAIDKTATTARTFRYTDIGCNEGDLTLEVARLLCHRLHSVPSDHHQTCQQTTVVEGEGCCTSPDMTGELPTVDDATDTISVHVTGIDLDPILIERAQQKVQQFFFDKDDKVSVAFQRVDVLKEGLPIDPCLTTIKDDDGELRRNVTLSSPNRSYTTDFTTLFSVTMWLHIHGGDDGLCQFLQRVCNTTQYFILLEIQPSKCYGTAAKRLRRLNVESSNIDVSNDRLKLRSNIEQAIESIVIQNGFERVLSLLCTEEANNQQPADPIVEEERRTAWNRSLRLYRRVSLVSS